MFGAGVPISWNPGYPYILKHTFWPLICYLRSFSDRLIERFRVKRVEIGRGRDARGVMSRDILCLPPALTIVRVCRFIRGLVWTFTTNRSLSVPDRWNTSPFAADPPTGQGRTAAVLCQRVDDSEVFSIRWLPPATRRGSDKFTLRKKTLSLYLWLPGRVGAHEAGQNGILGFVSCWWVGGKNIWG